MVTTSLPPQFAAINDAVMHLRQIECIAAMIRHGLDGVTGASAAQDAIGGLEALCEATADKLDAAFPSMKTEERS
jgi:hypothetical protein